MKKILVPCDFSVAAHRAYQFAREIAAAGNSEIVVLHVIKIHTLYGNGMAGQPYRLTDPVIPVNEIMQDARDEFEKMEKALDPASFPVHLVIRTGDLTGTILQVIAEESIELVVMATSGADGLREFLTGSNTEKVVRASPVPVFALHKLIHARDVCNIVFPTSLDLTQNEMILHLKRLQELFDAVLNVLYVNNFPTSLVRDEEVESSLRDYARFYSLKKFTLNVRNGGDLEETIVRFANTVPDSIIAMSTHGYLGFEHFLKGSVAEDLINHSGESVWTYVSPD